MYEIILVTTDAASYVVKSMQILWRCYVGLVSGRSVGGMSTVVLAVFLLLSCVVDVTSAGCNGMCQACTRRYGCMTPAWGKCCTQFYQHNGRKRNEAMSLAEHHQPLVRLLKTQTAKSVTSWTRPIKLKEVGNSKVTW